MNQAKVQVQVQPNVIILPPQAKLCTFENGKIQIISENSATSFSRLGNLGRPGSHGFGLSSGLATSSSKMAFGLQEKPKPVPKPIEKNITKAFFGLYQTLNLDYSREIKIV